MRLAQITPHLSSGGVEQRIARVLGGLDRSEHELTWIGLGEKNDALVGRAGEGVEVFSTPKSRRHGIDRGLILRIARILRRRRIEIVHVHNWSTSLYGIAAARLAGVERVIYGVGGREQPEGASVRQRAVMRVLAPYVDRFTTVCDFLAEEMATEWNVPRERVEVIRTGIDVDRFDRPTMREASRRRLGLPADAVVFGALTVLRPVKRIEDLIAAAGRAADEDPRVHVVLIGDLFTDSTETILGWAQRAGLDDRIRLPGRVEDPENLLAAIDVYVNCSEFEGASNAIMEAMAAARPVVATRVGGTPELVEEGDSALLVAPRDVTGLAGAFSRLAADRDLRARMGDQGRRAAEARFGLDRMVAGYRALYRRTADAPSKPLLIRSAHAARALMPALAMLADDRLRRGDA